MGRSSILTGEIGSIIVMAVESMSTTCLKYTVAEALPSKKLRMIIISFDPVTDVGGVEGRARGYLKHLVKFGHKVTLYDLSRSTKRAEITVHGAVVTFLSPSPSHVVVTLGTILRDVLSSRPDAIFILSGTDTIVGIAMLILTRILRIRSGVFIYGKDMLTAKKHFLRLLLLKLGLILTKRIGVNSIGTANLLPDSARKKLSLLYPGGDTSITEGVESSTSDSKTVLFVGRLIHRKGADDLIRAFSLLLKEIQDASLEVVGDGPEKENLEKLSISLGIQERVRFFGTLTGKNLYQRYANCTVFCMPSKSLKDDVEGFGTVFIEAALFGKPSVGTRSGGIPEAVLDGETGILVDEGDVQKLYKALLRLLEEEDFSKGLGRNGKRRALSDFTSEKATERLVKMFE